MGLKVLSLFDGISCGQLALSNLKIPVGKYYSSEIDRNAITITQKNFPNTTQIGDINSLNFNDYIGKIDFIMGGFPCQDLSICTHDRKCLLGERSGLFYRLLEAINTIKPAYFLVENVASMPDESKNIISNALGVKPIFINSAEVSAQRRKRFYWTNIPFLPENKKQNRYMHVEELLEENHKQSIVPNEFIARDKSERERERERERESTIQIGNIKKLTENKPIIGQAGRVYSIKGKTVSLCALGGGQGAKTGLYKTPHGIRRLSPTEAERAQCLPDGYTSGIKDSARYKLIGNAWNIATIEWILRGLVLNKPS